MSYKIKTLIVFDTNSLRSTEAGEVAYSFFAFGKPFQLIEEFIESKKLVDDIHIAVPTWAIEELKDQKQRQYQEDVFEYKKLAKRLSGLPHTGEIAFPEAEFDCAAFVQQKAEEYLATKQTKLLEIKVEIANDVLRSMMTRVMKDEGKKAPFSNSGKYKDAGFKDNVVWESLMNYEAVKDYDKIIFVCKDGDFNRHCIEEFTTKWERHIAIEKDENNVIYQLTKDYENYIEFRKYFDYSEKDYFKHYLSGELKEKTFLQLDGEEFPIENFKIENFCERVEKKVTEAAEESEEEFIIHAKVSIAITKAGEKINVPIDVQFIMDELFEIYELIFEPIIY